MKKMEPMKLTNSLILQLDHNNIQGNITVDKNGYFCLNEMALYYPQKRLGHWRTSSITVKYIEVVDKYLNESTTSRLKAIVSKSARSSSGGGTYAHKDVAIQFAMYLSPEFMHAVIRVFDDATQAVIAWDMERSSSICAQKIQTAAIAGHYGNDVRPHHFSNDARMLNVIIFGAHKKDCRASATPQQLEDITVLLHHDAILIEKGDCYADRKATLTERHQTRLRERRPKLGRPFNQPKH